MVEQLDVRAQLEIERGHKPPNMSVNHVLEARARIRGNKSAGGGELVVPDILRALPIMVVFMVATLLARRYKAQRENIATWAQIIMSFIPKEATTVSMKKYRGISLLACMRKWYLGVLMQLVGASPMPVLWRHVLCLGFLPRA